MTHDPDYGPYLGHPMDPRTPEPTEAEEVADWEEEQIAALFTTADHLHDAACALRAGKVDDYTAALRCAAKPWHAIEFPEDTQ